MASLNSILSEISAMLDVPDEELTEEQSQQMDSYLSELGQAEADKADTIGGFIMEQIGRIEATKAHADKLAAKAKAAKSRIDYLRARYTDSMLCAGVKKISGSVYDLSVRTSQAVSVTANIDEIPEEYKRTKVIVEPDKAKIKDMLKHGFSIPGCALVDNYSLQVR